MPGAAAAAVIYAAVQQAIIQFILRLVLSMVISAIIRKITEPKGSSSFSPNRMVTVRQPAAPRRALYGQSRIGGVLIFAHSADKFHDVQHVVNEIVPATAPFTVSIDAEVTGIFRIRARGQVDDGDPDSSDSYDEFLVEVPSSPGLGQFSRSGNVVTFGQQHGGNQVQITYTSIDVHSPSRFLHLVIVYAAHQVEEIGTIHLNDIEVPLGADGYANAGQYAGGYVRVIKHLGQANQAADAVLMSECPDKWTAAHRLRGHAYIYVTLLSSRVENDVFPSGVPNITAVIKGKNDIYDARTGLRGYTNNAALCIADYMCSSRFGLGCDYDAEINEDVLIASAHSCDEQVQLKDGTFESRYTLNGSVESAENIEDQVAKLVSSMAGKVIYSSGRWAIKAGYYETPIFSLDENDCRGSIMVSPKLPASARFSAVKGIYVSPTTHWQPTDYPPITNATYEAEDGERMFAELDLPYTTSPAAAQRIAKLELERARQSISVEMHTRLRPLQVCAGDNVLLNLTRFGWTNKPFEVVEWEVETYEDEESAPTIGTKLMLRETASGVFDWAAGSETTVDLSPDTNLPSPLEQPLAPGILPPVEELYETREGRGVAVRLNLECGEPFGMIGTYQWAYKPPGAERFFTLPATEHPRTRIDDVAPGAYVIRVRAITRFGIHGFWSEIKYVVTGLSGRPSAPTGLTIFTVSARAYLRVDPHPDLDVRRGGRFLVRHSEGTTGVTWETSYSMPGHFDGSGVLFDVPAKAGTYLVKAEDASGNQSESFASVVTKAGDVLPFADVDSLTEHPTFSGTKTNMIVDGSVLKIQGSGYWDSIPDVDAVSSIDGYGGFFTTGEYEFASAIDMGSVKKVRVFTELEVETFVATSLWDSNTQLIDDMPDIDGVVIGSAGEAMILASETDDDPSGSPTWSAWHQVVTSDYECRGLKFMLAVQVENETYGMEVPRLGVQIRELA